MEPFIVLFPRTNITRLQHFLHDFFLFVGITALIYLEYLWAEAREGRTMAYKIRVATISDLEQVLYVSNEAFLADSFFKKPEFHRRFKFDDIMAMFSKENAFFLVAYVDISDQVIGSIYLEIYTTPFPTISGHFSAVSVLSKYRNLGVGSALVEAAEMRLQRFTSSNDSSTGHSGQPRNKVMDIDVVSVRPDLIEWYKKKGYVVGAETKPAEFISEVQPELDVCLIRMQKSIGG